MSWQKIHGHQHTNTSGIHIKILFREVYLLGLFFIICQLSKFKFYVDLIYEAGQQRQGFKADLLLQQPSVNYFPKPGDAWIFMYFFANYVIKQYTLSILCLHHAAIEVNCPQWFVNRTKKIDYWCSELALKAWESQFLRQRINLWYCRSLTVYNDD